MVVGLLNSVVTFSNELSVITFGVFTTVFTVFFLQGIKRTILTPVVMAYMVPEETTSSKMIVPLKNEQYLYVGEFLAELIQWVLFMTVIFIIWYVRSMMKN